MKVSYEKLWKLMRENRMNKTDLSKAAEIAPYTMKQMSHNKYVSLEVIARLCKVFHCDVGDIVEMIED